MLNTLNVESALMASVSFYALMIILGLCIGSFLNVVITRLPLGFEHDGPDHDLEPEAHADNKTSSLKNKLWLDRSKCPQCQNQIAWYDNIPVLSYLLLKAKCRHCKRQISPLYPMIEILTALSFCLLLITQPTLYTLMAGCVLVAILIALSAIDIRHYILPDSLTLSGLWLGLLFNLSPNGFTSIEYAVIGAVVGYMTFWIIFQIHFLITKRQGMGYGDFKLAAMIGAWLGVFNLPYILFFAALSGIVIFVVLKLFKNHDYSNAIPFGPCLALGGVMGLMIQPAHYFLFI